MATIGRTAALDGEQEAVAADDDEHGFFTYDPGGTTSCWTVKWDRIESAVAAHVHKAPRHVAGPVVVPIGVGDGSGTIVSGCTEIDAGAIRGQLK